MRKFEGEVPEYNEWGSVSYAGTYTGNWRKGHWDYQLNRYVYDDEVESTTGKTTVGESAKAAKTASKRKTKKHIEDEDVWDDDVWYGRY